MYMYRALYHIDILDYTCTMLYKVVCSELTCTGTILLPAVVVCTILRDLVSAALTSCTFKYSLCCIVYMVTIMCNIKQIVQCSSC
jgi:hypothetical protein